MLGVIFWAIVLLTLAFLFARIDDDINHDVK